VHPTVQWPAEELKTEISRTPVPIPHDLVLELSAHLEKFSTEWVMCDELGRQLGLWALQQAFRADRSAVQGLPELFRFHDLRHYYASLLISSGSDVKVMQARLRHASAKTTLDTYAHLLPERKDKGGHKHCYDLPFREFGGPFRGHPELSLGVCPSQKRILIRHRNRARTPWVSLVVIVGG
jgi:hypothetical protein